MRISPERLIAEAEATGFQPELLEKTFHLLGLLNAINSHPFLRGKLVLKGGTALNLFVFDVPRLSVDIDLNYVGSESTEDMRRERAIVEEALQAVFSREEYTVRRMSEEHAGGQVVAALSDCIRRQCQDRGGRQLHVPCAAVASGHDDVTSPGELADFRVSTGRRT